MNASSREEVFEALRAKGIKAIKVVAADGSKANGAPPPRGWAAARYALLVVIVALAGALAWWMARDGNGRNVPGEAGDSMGGPRSRAADGESGAGGADGATSAALQKSGRSPRHQIYGDPAIMEEFERGEFKKVLPREGDRLLAIFAQPGKLMCAKGVNPRNLEEILANQVRPVLPALTELFETYVQVELPPEKDIAIADDEPREVRELKEIVNGMREEMREYLANGNGTPRSYWRRLNERTEQEALIFERTRKELEKETSPEIWDRKNEALRRLGLRTIPNPNE